MRFDKGGVVDLAREKINKKKQQFKIKKNARKIKASGIRGMTQTNPKYRDKAAKIVQGWWRELKGRY